MFGDYSKIILVSAGVLVLCDLVVLHKRSNELSDRLNKCELEKVSLRKRVDALCASNVLEDIKTTLMDAQDPTWRDGNYTVKSLHRAHLTSDNEDVMASDDIEQRLRSYCKDTPKHRLKV